MLLDFPRVRLFFFNVKSLIPTLIEVVFDIKGVQTRQRKVLKIAPSVFSLLRRRGLNLHWRLSLAFSTGHTLFSVFCFLLA